MVGSHTVSADSKARTGGGVAEACDYEFCERIHYNNNSNSKSTASQDKKGLYKDKVITLPDKWTQTTQF